MTRSHQENKCKQYKKKKKNKEKEEERKKGKEKENTSPIAMVPKKKFTTQNSTEQL